jgi:hypothetical protein
MKWNFDMMKLFYFVYEYETLNVEVVPLILVFYCCQLQGRDESRLWTFLYTRMVTDK